MPQVRNEPEKSDYSIITIFLANFCNSGIKSETNSLQFLVFLNDVIFNKFYKIIIYILYEKHNREGELLWNII